MNVGSRAARRGLGERCRGRDGTRSGGAGGGRGGSGRGKGSLRGGTDRGDGRLYRTERPRLRRCVRARAMGPAPSGPGGPGEGAGDPGGFAGSSGGVAAGDGGGQGGALSLQTEAMVGVRCRRCSVGIKVPCFPLWHGLLCCLGPSPRSHEWAGRSAARARNSGTRASGTQHGGSIRQGGTQELCARPRAEGVH